jgi:hypothetical protein
MAKFVSVSIAGIEPAGEIPSRENVISGSPRFKSWSVDEAAGGVSSGYGKKRQVSGALRMSIGSTAAFVPVLLSLPEKAVLLTRLARATALFCVPGLKERGK